MIELMLTVVGTPKGSVGKQQYFIMSAGPMTNTWSTWRRASSISVSGSVTNALRPRDPSLVHTVSSSLTLRIRSSQNRRLAFRVPMMQRTSLPTPLRALVSGIRSPLSCSRTMTN